MTRREAQGAIEASLGSGRGLPRSVSFWVLAALLAFFLYSATAPSPLYGLYQASWGFSPVTVTAIYAVYAAGALAAVLLTGRLSDHLGRRRVVLLALVVQLAGLIPFLVASGVEMLYVGRILHGIGVGTASGAISAWLLDLQPADNPRLGSIVGGISLLAGLGAGALGTGLLAEYAPNPLRLVFWLLMGVYAIALVTMFAVPDVVERRPGWLRSMRPQIGVPEGVRRLFVALIPSMIAIWALAGLYASLGPSVAVSFLESDSRIAGSLVIVALMGCAALASALVRAADPHLLLVRGSLVLIGGVALTVVGVALGSVTGLYAGSVVAGLGFGPAFSGVFRTLAPLAPPERRGALVASIYLVIYLSFSLPAILAGLSAARFGLRTTTVVYGVVVMLLASMTTLAVRRGTTTAPV